MRASAISVGLINRGLSFFVSASSVAPVHNDKSPSAWSKMVCQQSLVYSRKRENHAKIH
jgi:hypothetical protein